MNNLQDFIIILKRNSLWSFWFLIFLLAFTFLWSAVESKKTYAYLDITVQLDVEAVHNFWQTQVFFLKPQELVDTIDSWLNSLVIAQEIYKKADLINSKNEFIIRSKKPQFISLKFLVTDIQQAKAITTAMKKVMNEKVGDLQINNTRLIYKLSFEGPIVVQKDMDIIKRLGVAVITGILIIIFINLIIFLR